jgi:putative transposase
MKRRASTRVAARNTGLLSRIRALKAEHPFWGYRRLWAHLKFVDGLAVNKKRVLRLLRAHELLVHPNRRLRASRTPTTHKPKPTVPNQWWGIDMTKVLVDSFGWVYVVLVLDWYTKKLVGYHIGFQATSRHWLQALDMACNRQFPEGVRGQGLHLMSDNGCQPTSVAFMRVCGELGIAQAFTSYNNPKGNADTERVIRTVKEECLWLREWTSPFALAEALTTWIERDYNTAYLHSSLGYRTPESFEQQWITSHQTLLAPA